MCKYFFSVAQWILYTKQLHRKHKIESFLTNCGCKTRSKQHYRLITLKILFIPVFNISFLNNEKGAAQIGPSGNPGPFLFPFTAQIAEGRSKWVTSEIVYCYRLVGAHAILTRTHRVPCAHASHIYQL